MCLKHISLTMNDVASAHSACFILKDNTTLNKTHVRKRLREVTNYYHYGVHKEFRRGKELESWIHNKARDPLPCRKVAYRCQLYSCQNECQKIP